LNIAVIARETVSQCSIAMETSTRVLQEKFIVLRLSCNYHQSQ
jgi:hypothetical protein